MRSNRKWAILCVLIATIFYWFTVKPLTVGPSRDRDAFPEQVFSESDKSTNIQQGAVPPADRQDAHGSPVPTLNDGTSLKISKAENTHPLASKSAVVTKKQLPAADLGRLLEKTTALIGFKPSQNPLVPGCFYGTFLANSSMTFTVRFYLSMAPKTGALPDDPGATGYKFGNSSYVKVTSNTGQEWISQFKENPKFLRAEDKLENGILLEIRDSYALQLFPVGSQGDEPEKYEGTVFLKSSAAENWKTLSDVELVFTSGYECMGS